MDRLSRPAYRHGSAAGYIPEIQQAKELLTKYCIEDKTQQEIAAKMGLAQRAVGKQLQQLKKYFKKF